MFTFDLVINPVILLAAILGGAILGFIIGRSKLAKSHRRVLELEKEMMTTHAEILDIQRAYVQLENKLEEHSIPVISMIKNGGKEKVNGKDLSKEKATK